MKRLAMAAFALLLIAASPASETEHTVKEGETLGGIANRAGVAASAIAKANNLKEPYAVRIGQTLKIPRGKPPTKKPAQGPSGSYVVKEGETLGGIANRAGVSASAIAKANGLKEPFSVRTGQKLIIPGGKPSPEKPKAAASSSGSYVVKEGETLGGIANRAGVARIVIAEANGLREPYEVQAGQKLTIPRQRTHVVKAGETGFDIAYQYGIPFGKIAVANGIATDATLKVGQKLLIPAITRAPDAPVASAPERAPARFRWPLSGAIAEGFNSGEGGEGHNGIDIAAAEGEPVKAAASGIIIYAQMEKSRFGNLVIIDHGDRWHTAYGHMSRIAAKKGASVRAGEVIGFAGSTGTATSPELHFEVRNRNVPVEPQSVLGAKD